MIPFKEIQDEVLTKLNPFLITRVKEEYESGTSDRRPNGQDDSSKGAGGDQKGASSIPIDEAVNVLGKIIEDDLLSSEDEDFIVPESIKQSKLVSK